jgi:nucleoside-diphosphate-sugar epimerase
MATYLVTGGAGFIGSHIVETLIARGERVRVLDNLATGSMENLRPFEGRFEMIEADCADLASARRAVAGCDYVLHEAAIPSVPRSVSDPVGTDRANCGGTVTMLEASREAGVKRFVFAGSSAAYGDTPTLPKREDMPVHPQSPYAVQKVAGEHYCGVFHQTHGLKTVVLRYFNVFGPRQDPRSEYAAVVPRFATAALRGEPVTVYGDGQQSRDFTPVASAVAANLLACEREEAVGHVINVARGERLSLLQLIDRIGTIVGRKVEVRFAPPRPGDVRHSLADIARARDLLGYAPGPLDEALQRVVDFYRPLASRAG